MSKKERNLALQAKARERFKSRVVDPVKRAGKNVGNRLSRVRGAGLSTMGAAAMGLSGAAESLRDKEEAEKYFKRARNALRSARRSGKAVFMGEPKDRLTSGEREDPSAGIMDIAGDMLSDSEKVEYRKGGKVKSSASRRADGVAQRGKTRGKFV